MNPNNIAIQKDVGYPQKSYYGLVQSIDSVNRTFTIGTYGNQDSGIITWNKSKDKKVLTALAGGLDDLILVLMNEDDNTLHSIYGVDRILV